MKKIFFVFAIIVFLSSCRKDKCWIIMDCIGNDLQAYCGSEKEIKDYCAQHSPPGCQWTYRPE